MSGAELYINTVDFVWKTKCVKWFMKAIKMTLKGIEINMQNGFQGVHNKCKTLEDSDVRITVINTRCIACKQRQQFWHEKQGVVLLYEGKARDITCCIIVFFKYVHQEPGPVIIVFSSLLCTIRYEYNSYTCIYITLVPIS